MEVFHSLDVFGGPPPDCTGIDICILVDYNVMRYFLHTMSTAFQAVAGPHTKIIPTLFQSNYVNSLSLSLLYNYIIHVLYIIFIYCK